MFAVLKRLLQAILKVGLYEFLRRVGLRAVLPLIMIAVAIGLIVVVVLVMVVGIVLL